MVILLDSIFSLFFNQNFQVFWKSQKMKKRVWTCKIRIIVKVASLQKRREGIEKNNGKNIVFLSKIGLKSCKKARTNGKSRKIDKMLFPMTPFSAKIAFLVDFLGPKGTQQWLKIYEIFVRSWSWKPSRDHFVRLHAFFPILASFWVHSGSLLG